MPIYRTSFFLSATSALNLGALQLPASLVQVGAPLEVDQCTDADGDILLLNKKAVVEGRKRGGAINKALQVTDDRDQLREKLEEKIGGLTGLRDAVDGDEKVKQTLQSKIDELTQEHSDLTAGPAALAEESAAVAHRITGAQALYQSSIDNHPAVIEALQHFALRHMADGDMEAIRPKWGDHETLRSFLQTKHEAHIQGILELIPTKMKDVRQPPQPITQTHIQDLITSHSESLITLGSQKGKIPIPTDWVAESLAAGQYIDTGNSWVEPTMRFGANTVQEFGISNLDELRKMITDLRAAKGTERMSELLGRFLIFDRMLPAGSKWDEHFYGFNVLHPIYKVGDEGLEFVEGFEALARAWDGKSAAPGNVFRGDVDGQVFGFQVEMARNGDPSWGMFNIGWGVQMCILLHQHTNYISLNFRLGEIRIPAVREGMAEAHEFIRDEYPDIYLLAELTEYDLWKIQNGEVSPEDIANIVEMMNRGVNFAFDDLVMDQIFRLYSKAAESLMGPKGVRTGKQVHATSYGPAMEVFVKTGKRVTKHKSSGEHSQVLYGTRLHQQGIKAAAEAQGKPFQQLNYVGKMSAAKQSPNPFVDPESEWAHPDLPLLYQLEWLNYAHRILLEADPAYPLDAFCHEVSIDGAMLRRNPWMLRLVQKAKLHGKTFLSSQGGPTGDLGLAPDMFIKKQAGEEQ